MRRKARTDDNQGDIVKALRKMGVSVAVTSSLGKGYPDLVVGVHKKNFLIELKDGKKSASRKKLTPDEELFKERWKGQYDVCESLDEVLELIFKHKN